MDFAPMSPDEIQQTMQFLLRQQAQFAANFVRLSEKTDRLAEKTDRLAEKTDRLAERTDQLADTTTGIIEIVGDLTRTVGTVTGMFGDLTRAQQRTEERMSDLAEYVKGVESHLNVVIEMFERHLREDHGQKPS
jgi:methyl-accepting chemotaxis protein